MLKKLSDKHYEIIRRLVCGDSQTEICIMCDITQNRLSILKADPLFAQELSNRRKRVEEAFIASRVSAYQKLEDAAPRAADFCIDMLDAEGVPAHLKLKSAQDILDRTQAPKKGHVQPSNTVNAAQIIINAYNSKHGREANKDENRSEGNIIKDVSPICIEESGQTAN